MGNILDVNSSNELRVKVWHKFSNSIPHGWPERGCLFFTVNKGITIGEFLDQINTHRRPKYHIRHLYKHNGEKYNSSEVLYTNDLYI